MSQEIVSKCHRKCAEEKTTSKRNVCLAYFVSEYLTFWWKVLWEVKSFHGIHQFLVNVPVFTLFLFHLQSLDSAGKLRVVQLPPKDSASETKTTLEGLCETHWTCWGLWSPGSHGHIWGMVELSPSPVWRLYSWRGRHSSRPENHHMEMLWHKHDANT